MTGNPEVPRRAEHGHYRERPPAEVFLTSGRVLAVDAAPSAADLHEARFVDLGPFTVNTTHIAYIKRYEETPR